MESSEADTVLPAAALLVPPLLAAPAPSSAKRQRRAPKRADDDLENMGQVTGGRAPKKSKAVGSGAAGGAAGAKGQQRAPKRQGKRGSATYQDMMTEAVLALNDRSGSSLPAVCKWLSARYPDFKVNRQAVGSKFKQLVASGYFVKVKSSFKLSAQTKDSIRRAKNAKSTKTKGGTKAMQSKERRSSAKHKGVDLKTQVRQHLGLLRLVEDHKGYTTLTEEIA